MLFLCFELAPVVVVVVMNSHKRNAMQKKDTVDHNWEVMKIENGIELRIATESAEMLRDIMQGRGFAGLSRENCNAFRLSLAGNQFIH